MAEQKQFYDLVGKTRFTTSSYNVERDRRGRKRAVAKTPSGGRAYLYLSEDG